ncbi:MAG: prenyltransferase/squalene oxidase repeat-containing protein [Luteolibacter sp.]
MSIHVQLTPEALEALKRQKRNSTISSIVIATLFIVLAALGLGLFFLESYIRVTPKFEVRQVSRVDDPPIDKPKPTTRIHRNAASPSPSRAKVLAASVEAPTAIPVPEIEMITPSETFGDTDDFGFGFGDQSAISTGFHSLPPAVSKRCSPQDRLARLRETGGTPETELAVERGLEWLQSTQNPDGSWGRGQYMPAYTGLALLAYLGRCETPLSTKYGETVFKAIAYLIDIGMKNDGRLTTDISNKQWSYEHAIASYALAEAYTFCRQVDIAIPHLDLITKQSGQFIIDNQNANGGWAYLYAKEGGHVDSSVTGWQLQALKAMEYTGIRFEGLARAASRGVEYMESVQNANGGFGYRTANAPAGRGHNYFTMTGGGVLALQLWGKGNSAAVRNGARYIAEHSRFTYDGRYADMLGLYYEAQAMLNRGGEQWRNYNAMFRDELLSGEDSDGSWRRPATKADGPIRAVAPRFVQSVHYRTCLAILTLETYYRFLPGTGVAR